MDGSATAYDVTGEIDIDPNDRSCRGWIEYAAGGFPMVKDRQALLSVDGGEAVPVWLGRYRYDPVTSKVWAHFDSGYPVW